MEPSWLRLLDTYFHYLSETYYYFHNGFSKYVFFTFMKMSLALLVGNNLSLSVPDEGLNNLSLSVPDEGLNNLSLSVPDEGLNNLSLSVPDEGLNNLSLSVPDEGLKKHVVCTTFDIYVFILVTSYRVLKHQ